MLLVALLHALSSCGPVVLQLCRRGLRVHSARSCLGPCTLHEAERPYKHAAFAMATLMPSDSVKCPDSWQQSQYGRQHLHLHRLDRFRSSMTTYRLRCNHCDSSGPCRAHIYNNSIYAIGVANARVRTQCMAWIRAEAMGLSNACTHADHALLCYVFL